MIKKSLSTSHLTNGRVIIYLQAIDWRALEEKRVTPPFKPAVNGLLDTKVKPISYPLCGNFPLGTPILHGANPYPERPLFCSINLVASALPAQTLSIDATSPFLQYFDSEFTGQSVALTPPSDQSLITSIQEEEEDTFHRFSYQPEV